MNHLKLLIFSLLIVLTGCKKEAAPDPDPTPPPPPPSATTVKKMMVDSTTSKFLSTAQEIENGLFKYDNLPGIDSMKKGDFFIEPRDYGYLRKIESITKSNGEVAVLTTQGTLSEFYQDSGHIKRAFSIPAAENPFARKSNPGAKEMVSFPGINVSGNGWSLALENLVFSFDPNWQYEIDVKNKYLKAGFVNAQTKFEYDVSLTSDFTGKAETEFKLSSVFPVSKVLKVRIPNLFMQIHVVDFIVKVSLEGAGKLQPKFHYKNHQVTNAYLEYKNSVLNGVYNSASPVYESTRTMSITGGVTIKLEMYPVIRIREFGIPVINLGVKGIWETEVNHSLVSDTWDLKSQVYGGIFGNFNKTMFQYVAPEEILIKSPAFTLFEAPKTLRHLSGGNEISIPNTALKNPLEFQVFEANNVTSPAPEALVNVFFKSNYGKWANTKLRTDASGKVKNTFTMGPELKEHVLTAYIKNAANEVIDSQVVKLTPGNDTVAILQSHGPWKATEGTFDGDPVGVFVTHPYICDGPGDESIDEVSFTFGSNGAATIAAKGRLRCPGTAESAFTESSIFKWELLPGSKMIRATSVTDDTFFDMEIGDYFDFTILSFSPTEMEITGTPPGYENIRLKLK